MCGLRSLLNGLLRRPTPAGLCIGDGVGGADQNQIVALAEDAFGLVHGFGVESAHIGPGSPQGLHQYAFFAFRQLDGNRIEGIVVMIVVVIITVVVVIVVASATVARAVSTTMPL